jgi:predicted metal-dependent hydrolase
MPVCNYPAYYLLLECFIFISISRMLLEYNELEDIGIVEFIRSSRAKKITISVKPFRNVKVTLPNYVSLASAKNFVIEKRAWICQARKKMKNFENALTKFDENTVFRTKERTLEICRGNSSKMISRVTQDKIKVFYPIDGSSSDPGVQEFIKSSIVRALRFEANKYLPELLKCLAIKHGFSFCDLHIKNIKSRWGSCSSHNNINLNLHLLRLPDNLIEYVLLHELCHTKVKNHQREFWRLMEKVSPGAKELDKELKNYSARFI